MLCLSWTEIFTAQLAQALCATAHQARSALQMMAWLQVLVVKTSAQQAF